jgi:hypothetical protein
VTEHKQLLEDHGRTTVSLTKFRDLRPTYVYPLRSKV